MALRGIRIAEVGVRFPSGPPKLICGVVSFRLEAPTLRRGTSFFLYYLQIFLQYYIVVQKFKYISIIPQFNITIQIW